MVLPTNGSGGDKDEDIEEFDVEIEPVVGRKQVSIPLPRKESTWANIDPQAPCLESKEESPIPSDRRSSMREKSNSVGADTSIVDSKLRRRTKSHEEPKRRGRRGKAKKESVVEGESEPEESEQSETFDVCLVDSLTDINSSYFSLK